MPARSTPSSERPSLGKGLATRSSPEAAERCADAGGEVEALDRQIVRLRRGVDRLIDGYTEGIIDPDQFKPRLAGLKGRLTRLQSERDTAMAAHEAERGFQLVLGRIEEFAQRVRAGLDGLDWQARRDVIRTLVRRIESDRDQVEVVFRVPGATTPSGEGGSRPGSSPAADPEQVRQRCGRNHRSLVREDADDVGAALDLAVDAFERVGRVELGPVSGREGHVGQDVGFGGVHQGGELWHLGPELVGDATPLRLGGLGVNAGVIPGQHGGVKPGQWVWDGDMQRAPIGALCMSP